MRKALGEFFTPQWIAERIVDRAISLSERAPAEQIRFLDPTCGSGTFLVAALRRAIRAALHRGLSGEDCAREALDSVTGFDINPVSPLMARVNLLLALGDLADTLPEISFNVFQADSILIPEEPVGDVTFEQADAALTVPLVIGDVHLPNSLASIQAVGGLASILDVSIQRSRSEQTFRRRLEVDLPNLGVEPADASAALDAAAIIYAKLSALHHEGRDGIWAHVIEQSFAPRILEPVDIVVGNPPWISWKHLPKVWRTRSESTWKQWGLWQTKKLGGGTPMADISSLLLARCVATYAPDGLIALLLPEGILLNDPGGRAIRRTSLTGLDGKELRPYGPLFVDDFSTLNPFPDASNRPIALYVQAGRNSAFPVQMTEWTRASKRSPLPVDVPLHRVLSRLQRTESSLAPIDAKDPASKWRPAAGVGELALGGSRSGGRPYIWGQGFHTRGADGIFYCQVLSSRPTAGGLVRIRTRPDLGRNTKTVTAVEVLVEAEFLWPLLRGSNVQPFEIEAAGLYCIVPHEPERLSSVMSVNSLLKRAPKLYDYLEVHVDRLLNRSAYDLKLDSEHPWGIQGTAFRHLERNKHLVVCRYMEPSRRPPAAVCQPLADDKLGLTTTPYPNNKVNFVTCSSLREADYVTAFVNSKQAQDLIARLSSTTTISPSTINRMGIPLFDPGRTPYRELGRVAKALGEESLSL